MKRFRIWYAVDGVTKMTHWSGDTKESAMNDFWDWVIYEGNVVGVDCVEEV